MGLVNCKRLLKHFEATNQKEAAANMRANIAYKEKALKPKISKPAAKPIVAEKAETPTPTAEPAGNNSKPKPSA